jgi:hypothetical protein
LKDDLKKINKNSTLKNVIRKIIKRLKTQRANKKRIRKD